jgi:hypothetical protein
MQRRTLWKAVAAFVILGMVALGCETPGESIGAGALLGGAAGAIIGNQSGRAVEGALIGAAIGGLAGWAIHKAKVRQTRTAQQTVEYYDYQPAQGFQMNIESSTVSPTRAGAGGTVTTRIVYATMGAGNGINVQESSSLLKDGKTLLTLDSQTVTRTDGTWEKTLSFDVPDGAEPGTYTVAQAIAAGGNTFRQDVTFTVTSQNAAVEDESPALMIAAAE